MLETWPAWSGQRCRHVLVPVFAIGYECGRRRYRALVNGRTGQTTSQLREDALHTIIRFLSLVGRLLIVVAILAALGAGSLALVKAVF